MLQVTEEAVLDALKDVVDPEVGVNVVDLGLVYGVRVEAGAVTVDLTMTTPACPLGEQIQADAQRVLSFLPGVKSAEVKLVWEPAWTPDRMKPEARAFLGWGG